MTPSLRRTRPPAPRGAGGRVASGSAVRRQPLAEPERRLHQREVAEGLREVADHPPVHRVVLLGEQADVVDQRRPAGRRAGARRRGARPRRTPRPARTSRPGTGARRRRRRRRRSACGSAAAARRAGGPPRSRRWCRASGGRRPSTKPISGSTSSEASTSSVSSCCTNEPRRSSYPCSSTSARTSSRILPPARRRARRARAPRRPRTARSNAAHTIARECVNRRRGPRISQSPWSGSRQVSASRSSSVRCSAQALSSWVTPAIARLLQRDHHLAEHVALALADGGVADPHRPRAGVPGEVVEGVLGQAPGAVDGVHDLEVVGVAGHRPQQPVLPELGLVGEARGQQRLEGERGVAQPAVAVVPVALAAEVLGQRGGRRGDDAAGLLVGQQPQGEQRAADDVGVRHRQAGAGQPVALLLQRGLDPRRGGRAGRARRPTTGTRSWTNVSSSPARDVELVGVPVVGSARQPRARAAPAGRGRRSR